jgi:hypothetical protein
MPTQDIDRLNMQTFAMQVRGHAIQTVCEIEHFMNLYIVDHFTKDELKQEEFMCVVMAPRMPFDSVRQIFCYLVKKHNPEFKNSLPAYEDMINKIGEYRNALAHHPLDVSDKAVELFKNKKKISFVKFRNTSISNGKTSRIALNSLLVIGDEEYKVLIDYMYACRDAILTLLKSKQQAAP